MERHAGAVPASPLPLDPAAAARAKTERLIRFHTVRSPRLRLVGNLVFVAFAWAHNLVILDDPSLRVPLLVVTAATAVYVIATWVLLVAFYERVRWIDLGDLFLCTDGFVALATIYATGGDRSLLFFYMTLRAADQSAISSRRTAFFAAASSLLYLALMIGLDQVPGRAVDWQVVMVKLGFIVGINLYLVGVAGAADRYRRRTSEAVRLTRSLVADLERKSTQLEDEQVRAQAANLAKSQFLANMSHEIRTPMSAIIGLNRLQRNTELPPDAAVFAEKIEESADDLLRLIDDILDLSRVEANKLQIERRAFELAPRLEHVAELLQPRSESKGIGLLLQQASDLPAWVHGDAARIQQVLINLVGNAIKFTEQGTVTVSVTRGLLQDICFHVRDTGIGIDTTAQRELFEPFYQADASATRRFGGTGLGLAISRRLVLLMGGTLDLESTLGQGSTFTVRLPLPPSAPSEAHQPATRAPETTGASSVNAHVLVADDNDVNRLVLQLQLEGLGARVDSVPSGALALESLGRQAYDLLLLDCQMPGLDGYEVARRIRDDPRLDNLPVIAVTAHAMRGARNRCLEAGMDDYLAKPFREGELPAVIERWLRGRRAAEPARRDEPQTDDEPQTRGEPAEVEPTDQLSPETPVLDHAKIDLIERLGHDVLTKVVTEFLKSTPARVAELASHLAAGDTASAARTTHTLVGSTGMAGTMRLCAVCAQLHYLVEAGELGPARARVGQVEAELEAARQALRSFIERE